MTKKNNDFSVIDLPGTAARKDSLAQNIYWRPDVRALVDELFKYESISVVVQALVLQQAGLIDLAKCDFHAHDFEKIMNNRAKSKI